MSDNVARSPNETPGFDFGPKASSGTYSREWSVDGVVGDQTWLALIHLMAGTVTGFLALSSVVTLALVGISTLWFFLAGLPILAVMLWLCLQFARAERVRFAVTLGARLPAPPLDLSSGASMWRRVRRLLAAPATRTTRPGRRVRSTARCSEPAGLDNRFA